MPVHPRRTQTKERPGGELVAVQGRLQDVISNGFPEVGWEGDPLLRLTYNRKTDAWNIHDHAFSPPQLIIAKPAEGIRDLDYRELCRKLKEAQFKGQGVQTIVARMEARNAAIEAGQDKRRAEFHEEMTERLAWAIRRDLD